MTTAPAITGLSSKEAKKALERFGLNEIRQINQVKWWQILISQFMNIMVGILAVAVVVSALLHEWVDAIAIAIILLLNAVVGFIQEYKAERAVEALKEMAAPHAIVIRDGETRRIDARHVVPGDILVLEEGMRIPADAQLIRAMQLQVIEASLTGESQPAHKSPEPVPDDAPLGDRTDTVFLGTAISQGHGLAEVQHTGMQTEFGKLAHMVQSAESQKTPLNKQLDKLSRLLAFTVIGIALSLFALSFITDKDPWEVLLLSISLVVGAIPEGLPAVITLTLALGVQRMAKHNAIVRKLPAAETLGSTSVICTDKTGTLTQNQMTVKRLYLNGEEYKVAGTGYAPKGEIDAPKSKELEWLVRIAALCNNSKLLLHKGKWDITGDPTEACLLTMVRKAGEKEEALQHKWERTDEIVFDSKRKLMSTRNGKWMLTKGAPDAILEHCTHIQENGKVKKLTPKKKKELLAQNDALASKAYRVLGFAYKEQTSKKMHEKDLIFVGFVGMMDPARPEVKKAIETCRSAHIDVVMITGDHALTAKAVGEQIGLYKEGDQILTGAELNKMSDKELAKRVESVRIFARVSPKHKVKILQALQSKGHIVSMTGDGVNDAPALKNADIGVAMGITGTDVAKEASEMILSDDNFATIVDSVKSGRTIYRNIKKFVRFLLSANFAEVAVVSLIFLMGYPSPLLPLHILWINLLTDAFPAIALGLDPAEEDIMDLRPRDPNQSIWKDLIGVALVVGIIGTMICLSLFLFHYGTDSLEYTRTIVFNALVIFELLMVFALRSDHHHYFKDFFRNPALIGAVLLSLAFQLAALYLPFFQKTFETVPLTVQDWALILVMCLMGVAIVEIWKSLKPRSLHV